MSEHFPLLLAAGEAAAGSAAVEAPFDRSAIATIEQADRPALERALERADALHRDRDAWLPPPRRIEILDRARALLETRAESLALEAAREGGKPLIDSKVEMARALDGVRLAVETLGTQSGREIPMNLNAASMGRMAFTQLEPRGVVLAFSAFNHPLNLTVHQVVPAIAAGCPVLIKPAEATPLSCMRIVQILREAGLPPEWCQAFQTTNLDVAGALVEDPRVAYFTFIGSARVGWRLRGRLAPGARCALEHGGAAPVIVAQDADLEAALEPLAKGGFYHAGQVCVSVQRIFAAEPIARELAAGLALRAGRLRVGDPTLPDTEVGPLIRPSEVERVDTWVREALDAGAELLAGGEALSATCYQPTVLYDPPAAAKVSTQEVFGPVVCVYPFTDLDEAIRRANDVPYAFQAAVFTRNLDTAWRAARRLEAMAVMVNDHTAFRVDWMPFGGRRESGLGVGGIPYTMEEMQVEKLTVIRSAELG